MTDRHKPRPEYSHKYYLEHKEHLVEIARRDRKELRSKVIEMMGGKCVHCGETDSRCLQIDHINGHGIEDRLLHINRQNLLRYIIKHGYEGKYQLLCANCNWRKRYDNNEVWRYD